MSNDAVFLFTFSPIQPFISESRRTADLHTASQILVRLSRAAGKAIQANDGVLVYPADLSGDMPNKLAAEVEWQRLDAITKAVEQAFSDTWEEFHSQARKFLNDAEPTPDGDWQKIWDRQVNQVWELFWSAARIDPESQAPYRRAYHAAQQALDARKRARAFLQSEEPLEKDTLSGRRQALTVQGMRARDYWSRLRRPSGLLPSDLRPGGRERLDALGAVKRFCDLARNTTFPSTSALAARTFSAKLDRSEEEVKAYISTLEQLLGRLTIIEPGSAWKYDGDLLYLESLTRAALEENYILTGSDTQIEENISHAAAALRKLYRKAGERPNTYYAVLALDGDNMGAHVDSLLSASDPRAAHVAFGQKLAAFGEQAKERIVRSQASPVYSGGDDVLALAPLSEAVPLARDLMELFHEITGATCSTGLVIVHHTYPLGAALEAARRAEKEAKQQPGKDTLCIRVLKRSGETMQMFSKRAAMSEEVSQFAYLVNQFQGRPSPLSGRLPYAVMQSAYALPTADPAFAAELNRLVRRHSQKAPPPERIEALAKWAAMFRPNNQQVENLAHWLGLARFIAKGGRE